jgi:hypothetical protein
MAATATLTHKWSDQATVMVIGSLALTGDYATGGIDLDFRNIVTGKPGVVALPGVSKQPWIAKVFGIAGYLYEYDLANKKLIIRQAGAVTPAGTLSKPTFTITKGAILASSELGLSADATSATVNNNTIAANLTLLAANSPVGAPVFTGSATTAAALAELPASALPAGVTGDTITFEVRFPKV